MEVTKIELDKNKSQIFGIKSAILWGYDNQNSSFPVAYLNKPKYMKDEEFYEILDKLYISLKKNEMKHDATASS